MMNRYQLMGNWVQIKGHFKEKWFQLTGNRPAQMSSRREIVVGKVQQKYDVANAAAEACVAAWERRSGSFG